MRRLLLSTVTAVSLALVSVGAAGDAVAAQNTTFGGTWTSTDNDGSSQTLTITGSGRGVLVAFLYDDAATGACGGLPAHFVGTGVADGETLGITGTLTCLPGGNTIRHRISFELFYVTGNDTLADETGVVWHRA